MRKDLGEAWYGRGNVLTEISRYDEALAAYRQALSLRPNLAEAWYGFGNVLSQLKRYGEAFAAYDKSAMLNPDSNLTASARLSAKLRVCDWINLDADIAQLLAAIEDGKTPCSPFSLLGIPASPYEKLQCARRYIQDQPTLSPLWRGDKYFHDRIRVAYVSPDLREHAVAYLMAGVFEKHDRSRFEITAMSWGPQHDTEFCRRLRASFDRFEDMSAKSDQQIAELIRQREIDIVVDLNGFSGYGRVGILGWRPAPVQVNYLGYAGTMGADYYDYIIADRTIIPAEHFDFYSEKVGWLPDTFMASDSARPISERTPIRSELGLPESGFVFCCFNQSFKINPETFNIWMRLLREVEGSVLWLKDNDPTSTQNLRREAQQRGVDADRLVFASTVPDVSEHLARHRHADLFLDTLHYNAHTVTSDCFGPAYRF